ncbi:MAG: DUF1697 domain-containing protein, partial [Paracoccaceae bacterium]
LGRVETYIQSGNAVFDSDLAVDVLEGMISTGTGVRFGFSPAVFVLEGPQVSAAATDHPFGPADPAKVHVFFLREMPERLDDAGMRALAAPGDDWVLVPGRFTLHTPAGIGRSKLGEKLDRFLPGDMTARNLRTVAALDAMIKLRA